MRVYRVSLGPYTKSIMLAEDIVTLLERLHREADASADKYPWNHEGADKEISIVCLGEAQ